MERAKILGVKVLVDESIGQYEVIFFDNPKCTIATIKDEDGDIHILELNYEI